MVRVSSLVPRHRMQIDPNYTEDARFALVRSPSAHALESVAPPPPRPMPTPVRPAYANLCAPEYGPSGEYANQPLQRSRPPVVALASHCPTLRLYK